MTEPAALDRDDWCVVGAGVVTFALAWAPWYEARNGAIALTGWGLGFAAMVAVAAAGYAAGRVVLLRGRPPKPGVPITPQAETFFVSAVALVLILYRIADAPTISGAPGVRTVAILAAGLAILGQFVCAARKLGRTGVRASS